MRLDNWIGARTGTMSAWLAFLVCCGVAALTWLGYRVANEWQRSATRLVERRTNEIADLVTLALTRDMRAVQTSVLDGRDWDRTSLAQAVRGPSRYSRGSIRSLSLPRGVLRVGCVVRRYRLFCPQRTPANLVAFASPPGFLPSRSRTKPRFGECAVRANPARHSCAKPLCDVRHHDRRPLLSSGRSPYSTAMSRVSNRKACSDSSSISAGCETTTSRRSRIRSLASRKPVMASPARSSTSRSGSVVGSNPRAGARPARRAFPLIFFDPIIAATGGPADLLRRDWTVNVVSASDPTLTIAAKGARRAVVMMGAGAVAVALGLVVAVSASRAAADTAAMRADFVSTVTHGLKTPVSVIRGIGETLIRGRVTSPKTLHRWPAQLLVQESHRLTRLIENMLAYAKVTDAADVYVFDELDPERDRTGRSSEGFSDSSARAATRSSSTCPNRCRWSAPTEPRSCYARRSRGQCDALRRRFEIVDDSSADTYRSRGLRLD